MSEAHVAERLKQCTLSIRRRAVVAKRGVLTRSRSELVGLPSEWR
jgi:hypothetical protein